MIEQSQNESLEYLQGAYSLSSPLVEPIIHQVDNMVIRTVPVADEFIFILRDVFVKIGTHDPKNSSQQFHFRYKERYSEYFRKVKIKTAGGIQEVLAGTEELVYLICFRSNTDLAYEFQKKVARLLKQLRKQHSELLIPHQSLGSLIDSSFQLYESQIQDLKREHLQLKSSIQLINEKVTKVQTKQETLDFFIENRSLSISQAGVLRAVAHQLASLRAKKEGYSIPKQRHYSEVYSRFKCYFNLSKYSDLPSQRYKEGLAFLNKWLMKEERRGELI